MLRAAIAPPVADRARRLIAFLPLAPALIGAAYLVLFFARLPRLLENLYWEADASNATVIAQTAGHGTIVLQRFGYFTALWFALLTRSLPLHRQIWEVGPYLFSLVSVALLAWASWRLAGVWAAAMSATAAVATSPFVSFDLVTLNYHTTTWAGTVMLAAYCLWLAREPPATRVAPVAVLMAALAGTTLASDHLFAFTAIVPLGLTGLLMLSLPRLRGTGKLLVASACVAPVIAWLTAAAMKAVHIEVFPAPTRFADDTELWPNVGRLLKEIVQLANGDYWFEAYVHPRTSLSFVCAVLMLIALAAPFVLVRRELRSGSPSVPLLVYSTFWAASITFNSLGVVLSSEGAHPGYYFISILYAVAGTAPLVLAENRLGRVFVCVGVAVVATASVVNLVDEKTALRSISPPVTAVADQIVDVAKKEDAPYGYADYWDATPLTWNTHFAVRVQPVSQCHLPANTELCPFWFNINTSWYTPHDSKSFVLRDFGESGVKQDLPASLGPPSAVYKLSDLVWMYVFPYDVASRLDYNAVTWHPEKPPSPESG